MEARRKTPLRWVPWLPSITDLPFRDLSSRTILFRRNIICFESLHPKFSVILGKLNVLYLADQTLFGDSYKYDFANFNFNKNPIALNFFNIDVDCMGLAYGLSDCTGVTLAGGVFDPNSQANNFATDAFDSVNLYGAAVFSYKVGGLPGQFMPQFNWTNKEKIDQASPFGQLSQTQIPQAIGVLLAASFDSGPAGQFHVGELDCNCELLAISFYDGGHSAITQKLKSGQPLRGLGCSEGWGMRLRNQTPSVDTRASLCLHTVFSPDGIMTASERGSTTTRSAVT